MDNPQSKRRGGRAIIGPTHARTIRLPRICCAHLSCEYICIVSVCMYVAARLYGRPLISCVGAAVSRSQQR